MKEQLFIEPDNRKGIFFHKQGETLQDFSGKKVGNGVSIPNRGPTTQERYRPDSWEWG